MLAEMIPMAEPDVTDADIEAVAGVPHRALGNARR